MATSQFPKDLDNYMPILKDQGLKNLVGTYKRGESMQHVCTTMPADGIILFATFGLSPMANVGYAVIVQNHTDVADPGKVTRANRLVGQVTVEGPDTGDELDIVIIGQMKGQLDT
jgi:hypothetical protein